MAKGDDLGWSWREGLHQYFSPPAPTTPPAAPNPGDPPGTGFTRRDPIYEYDHTNDGVGSDAVVYGPNVTGGMVYRGNRLTELYGAYIFADYGNGFIVVLREQTNGTWLATRLATDDAIVDFGPDPRNGDTIFCDLGVGTVKRLARSGTAGTNPPATLSATGAFSNLATLTPNTGIVDYEPNVAFWSDYAIKSRWFAIKNLTDTVGFSANGNWTLPAGMVWIKHFDIETTRGNPATQRKLETRILVKTATDIYGLSYKWRADQTDADLVAEDGVSEVIPASSPAQTWRYPSRTERRVCHTGVAGFALSFNTRQMNRVHPYGALTPNQLSAMGDAGYFAAAPASVNTLPFGVKVPARQRRSADAAARHERTRPDGDPASLGLDRAGSAFAPKLLAMADCELRRDRTACRGTGCRPRFRWADEHIRIPGAHRPAQSAASMDAGFADGRRGLADHISANGESLGAHRDQPRSAKLDAVGRAGESAALQRNNPNADPHRCGDRARAFLSRVDFRAVKFGIKFGVPP